MKIEIELNQETCAEVQRVAAFCKTTPVRVAEWIVQEQGNYLHKCGEGGTVWLGLIKYIREFDGDSKRLSQLERYINAVGQRWWTPGRTVKENRQEIRLMDPHFETLEAWLQLIGETD